MIKVIGRLDHDRLNNQTTGFGINQRDASTRNEPCLNRDDLMNELPSFVAIIAKAYIFLIDIQKLHVEDKVGIGIPNR